MATFFWKIINKTLTHENNPDLVVKKFVTLATQPLFLSVYSTDKKKHVIKARITRYKKQKFIQSFNR